MPLPKKIKKDISLIERKTLLPRRHEIADMFSQKGTYLPKSFTNSIELVTLPTCDCGTNFYRNAQAPSENGRCVHNG